jgi:hypothetical protein
MFNLFEIKHLVLVPSGLRAHTSQLAYNNDAIRRHKPQCSLVKHLQENSSHGETAPSNHQARTVTQEGQGKQKQNQPADNSEAHNGNKYPANDQQDDIQAKTHCPQQNSAESPNTSLKRVHHDPLLQG